MWTFLTSPLGRGVSIAFVILGLMASCGVQSARLKNAKGDLADARAALLVPGSKVTWQSKAEALQIDLNTCHGNLETTSGKLEAKNQAVETLKGASAQWGADVSKAIQAGKKQGLAAQSAGDRVLDAKVTGADLCSRMLDMERTINEASK